MSKILLVGAGHMGKALLKSWVKNNIKKISIIDPKLSIKNKEIYKIKVFKTLKEIKNINTYNVIFFAIKPQIINEVLDTYKKLELKNKLILSIVAGKNINFFEKKLGKNISIIRTMPNMPASIEKGVTCLFPNKNVNLKQKKFSDKLFKSVGKTFWVNNENYINKFTAISGSGPAYYYYVIECLRDAAVKLGISNNLSYEIAKETAIGSINLLENSKENATTMRKRIAIKGGTTEAAINALKVNKKMQKVVYSGVKAAFKKAIKIGK